jgi:hypothetical protein
MEIKQIQPLPQSQSPCPFCGKAHPLKQICRERLEDSHKARRQRTRPFRHGRDRVERSRWPGAMKPGSALSMSAELHSSQSERVSSSAARHMRLQCGSGEAVTEVAPLARYLRSRVTASLSTARGPQKLLRPISIPMVPRREHCKATTIPLSTTTTAIPNCRRVSIADRSLSLKKLPDVLALAAF